jgi:hypothetical protein
MGLRGLVWFVKEGRTIDAGSLLWNVELSWCGWVVKRG